MDFNLLIGISASVFTGTSLLPQLVKIIQQKKADEISFWMLGVLLAGLAFWVWYGILEGDAVIIAANAFSALVNMTIMFFAIKYRRKTG
jgi:MtN3 and saliva related transmembrane protein